MDFADHADRKFLIAVDNYSGWQTVFNLEKQAITSKLINATRDLFCIAGVPNVLWSDGGPQFRSKAFQDFLKRWGVTHGTSSPMYPQSNGKAEAAVKSTKKLLRRCWNAQTQQLDHDLWVQGILQHRNTPGPSGLSPAQILYGRPVQDMLPAHRRNFAEKWQTSAEQAEAAAIQRQEKVEERYNAHATDLPVLKVGSKVAIQSQDTRLWDRFGEVVEVGKNRRYFVKLASGRVLSRNRRHLRRRYGHAPPGALPRGSGSSVHQPRHLVGSTPSSMDVPTTLSTTAPPGTTAAPAPTAALPGAAPPGALSPVAPSGPSPTTPPPGVPSTGTPRTGVPPAGTIAAAAPSDGSERSGPSHLTPPVTARADLRRSRRDRRPPEWFGVVPWK